MKTNISLQNPKRFPELLLFFGMVLVFFGSGMSAITKDTTLANDGWILVVIAVFLWVLKESKGRFKHW